MRIVCEAKLSDVAISSLASGLLLYPPTWSTFDHHHQHHHHHHHHNEAPCKYSCNESSNFRPAGLISHHHQVKMPAWKFTRMISRKLAQELTRIMLQKSLQSLLNLEKKKLWQFASKFKAQCTRNMQDATCKHATGAWTCQQWALDIGQANNRQWAIGHANIRQWACQRWAMNIEHANNGHGQWKCLQQAIVHANNNGQNYPAGKMIDGFQWDIARTWLVLWLKFIIMMVKISWYCGL